MKFELTGPLSHDQIESTPPYAIFGDNTSGSTTDYHGQVFPVGNYTLTATPYEANSANGAEGTPWTIHFSLVEGDVTTYTLQVGADVNGSASADPSETELISGTSVTVTAEPNEGYQFSGWANEVGSIISIANPYTFDLFGNTTLEAKFTLIPTTNTVTSFTLVDALNDVDLMTLTEGIQINIADLPTNHLSIRANTGDGDESVRMVLSGTISKVKVESVEPYALYGDSPNSSGGRNYTGADFPLGNYTIEGTAFTGNSASGNAGATNTLSFSIVGDSDPSLNISELLLINADTDQTIGSLTEGQVIDLSAYPANTNFAIIANASNNTESVSFALSGAMTIDKTESVPPYALYGDGSNGSDFYGDTFSTGNYTIKATPYSANGASGQIGMEYSINFSVTDGVSARSAQSTKPASDQVETSTVKQIKVYPNPILEGDLTLEFPVMIEGELKYYLVDALNRVLDEGEVSLTNPSTKLRLDFSDLRLQQGTYYLKVIDANGNYFGIRLQK